MTVEPNVVLLGGAPAIGKSTLARKLAGECAFDYLSTDMVRRIARTVTTQDQYPGMHLFMGHDPEQYFDHHTTDEFIAHFKHEADDVFTVLRNAIAQYPAFKNRGVVVEGVNLMPELVAEYAAEKGYRYHVLVAQKKETITQTIMNRGLWASSSESKAKEIAFVWALNNYFLETAQAQNVPVIPVEPIETLDERARHAMVLSYA